MDMSDMFKVFRKELDWAGRKLILEISGLSPPPALVPAQFEPTDCLIGEKLYRQRNWDQIR